MNVCIQRFAYVRVCIHACVHSGNPVIDLCMSMSNFVYIFDKVDKHTHFNKGINERIFMIISIMRYKVSTTK